MRLFEQSDQGHSQDQLLQHGAEQPNGNHRTQASQGFLVIASRDKLIHRFDMFL